MRTLAIGDIHGCHVALETLLNCVAPVHDDRLIFLGDYIDRGPASRAVIETLMSLPGKCRATFLRGNHEVMLLESRTDFLKANLWQGYGGFEALASYGAHWQPNTLEWTTAIPDSHWRFFEGTIRYFETENHIFVHACLDPELDMNDQPDWLLFWEPSTGLKPHKSGKRVICGHTPQRSGQILNLGFALCIDTGAVNGGWLTCLDVTTGQWWQANEKRETRRGSIADTRR